MASIEAGEIVEILPPDPKASDWWMVVNKLRMEILQKKKEDWMATAGLMAGFIVQSEPDVVALSTDAISRPFVLCFHRGPSWDGIHFGTPAPTYYAFNLQPETAPSRSGQS